MICVLSRFDADMFDGDRCCPRGAADSSLTIAVNNQKNDIDIPHRQLEASLLVIKALGGSWSIADLQNFSGPRPGNSARALTGGR